MMDPSEVEFLAEKELVTIIPNFSHNKFYLISEDIGPFNPGLPVDVPLWLAINMKQRQKCRIQPPEWMNVGKRKASIEITVCLNFILIFDEYFKSSNNIKF